MANKEFNFAGMVNDMAKKIEEAAENLRGKTMFGYFWDGKHTQGKEELNKLSDEHLKRLVIQGNVMISAAAQIRVEREREALKKGNANDLG